MRTNQILKICPKSPERREENQRPPRRMVERLSKSYANFLASIVHFKHFFATSQFDPQAVNFMHRKTSELGNFPIREKHSQKAGNSPKEEKKESKKPGGVRKKNAGGFEFQRKEPIRRIPKRGQRRSESVLLKKKPRDLANWNLKSSLLDATSER